MVNWDIDLRVDLREQPLLHFLAYRVGHSEQHIKRGDRGNPQ